MKIIRTTLTITLAAFAIAAAGCTSSGSDTTDTRPDITLGTVPDPEAAPTIPAPTEPTATGSVDDADPTLASTTTMLTPSSDRGPNRRHRRPSHDAARATARTINPFS